MPCWIRACSLWRREPDMCSCFSSFKRAVMPGEPSAAAAAPSAPSHVAPLLETPKRAKILRKLRSRPSAGKSLLALGLLILAIVVLPFFAPQNPYDLMALDIMDGRLPRSEERRVGQESDRT